VPTSESPCSPHFGRSQVFSDVWKVRCVENAFRIGQQPRAREFRERGIADLGRCGCDDVSEADVNLNGNLCAFEIRSEGHADAFVVGILGYASRFDGLGIEAQAVLVDFQDAEFPKNMGEALRRIDFSS
jgi:hypothetical protein